MLGGGSDAQFMRDRVLYDCIGCVAQNNVITNTTGFGMGCMGGSDVAFYNNTAVNVALTMQAGLWVVPNPLGTSCTITKFQNNVVYLAASSTRPMVHVVNAGPFPSDYNVFFSPVGRYQFWRESPGSYKYVNFTGWQQLTSQDLRSLTCDPLVNAANLFKPLVNSPLILRGLSVPGVVVDYAGVPRPTGTAITIGAHEPLR
jgi:hypothetical protein